LKLLLGAEAENLAELALRFTLSHDAVSTVIPGMRRAKHVTSNISYSDGRKLTSGMLWRLKQFEWDRSGDW
jgi:aryl-alcohol dehydrogenase-like predicted oxidoreductase